MSRTVRLTDVGRRSAGGIVAEDTFDGELSEALVDVAAMGDLDDEHQDLVVIDRGEDTVIAYAVTPEILVDELLPELSRVFQMG